MLSNVRIRVSEYIGRFGSSIPVFNKLKQYVVLCGRGKCLLNKSGTSKAVIRYLRSSLTVRNTNNVRQRGEATTHEKCSSPFPHHLTVAQFKLGDSVTLRVLWSTISIYMKANIQLPKRSTPSPNTNKRHRQQQIISCLQLCSEASQNLISGDVLEPI